MLNVTVITPSIPRRSYGLTRCIESVRLQEPDWRAKQHMIMIDNGHPEEPLGPVRLRNQMVNGVTSDWLVFLDDDDVIHYNFFKQLWPYTKDYDVVIPHCLFDGPAINPIFVNQPTFDRVKLREHGQFPITCLVRTDAVLAAGAFQLVDQYEDWGMWNRMADVGARFLIVPEVLWTYRTRIDQGDDRRTAEAMEGRR